MSTWDEDKIFGCVCESSWSVGLGSGETQEPEWFGPDCSLRKLLAFHSTSSILFWNRMFVVLFYFVLVFVVIVKCPN